MSNEVTLTKTEAIAVLLVLKSITYERLNSEAGLQFQATLANLGERINESLPGSCDEQYDMWGRLGCPAWGNTHQPQPETT